MVVPVLAFAVEQEQHGKDQHHEIAFDQMRQQADDLRRRRGLPGLIGQAMQQDQMRRRQQGHGVLDAPQQHGDAQQHARQCAIVVDHLHPLRRWPGLQHVRRQHAHAKPGHHRHPATARSAPQAVVGPQQQERQGHHAHAHMLGQPQLDRGIGHGHERVAMRPAHDGGQQRPAGRKQEQAYRGVAEHPRHPQAMGAPEGPPGPARAPFGPAPLQHHRDGETDRIGLGGRLQASAPPPMQEAGEEGRGEHATIASQQGDTQQQPRVRMQQRGFSAQIRMMEEARAVFDTDTLEQPAGERDHTRVHPPSATSRNHCVSSPRVTPLRTSPRSPHRAGADVTPPSTTMR